MKYEWRKANREIYQIKSEPCLIDVPAQSFIMIDGAEIGRASCRERV